MLFAITDIETTGQHASGGEITEIAVILHDGERVIDTFHTLVHPGVPVPYYIQRLTGITDEMLIDAPGFSFIADDLLDFMGDSVFVAHNANFDFSFIRAAFRHAGINWHPRRLCTVRLAKKAFPGLPSYSLSKVCASLDILHLNPHRALGDAEVTTRLFAMAYETLGESKIIPLIAKASSEAFLPHHLERNDYERLPETCGVYYFMDSKGQPLYVGKAKNLKKRVRMHFSGDLESARLQAFLSQIHSIKHIETGNELAALLLEDSEIRRHWPRFNRAQKNAIQRFGVVHYTDQRGYGRLAASSIEKHTTPVESFANLAEARNWLIRFAQTYGIDFRLAGLQAMDNHDLPSVHDHNQQLQQGLSQLKEVHRVKYIEGKGRSEKETALIQLRGAFAVSLKFVSQSDLPSDSAMEASVDISLLPSEINSAIVKSYLRQSRGYRLLES
jgi:DNA polymerase III subunit epsilon